MAATNVSLCSVCLQRVTLTSAGVVRAHGPIGRGAKGLEYPRELTAKVVLSSGSNEARPRRQPDSLPQSSPIWDETVTARLLSTSRIMKRTPSAAREQCRLKLESILKDIVRIMK